METVSGSSVPASWGALAVGDVAQDTLQADAVEPPNEPAHIVAEDITALRNAKL